MVRVRSWFWVVFFFTSKIFLEKSWLQLCTFLAEDQKRAREALCWVMLCILLWACLYRLWYPLFQDNSEVHFKIKKTTQLKKLKQAYADRQVCVVYIFLFYWTARCFWRAICKLYRTLRSLFQILCQFKYNIFTWYI